MQSQAFGLSLADIGLDEIDAERDLLESTATGLSPETERLERVRIGGVDAYREATEDGAALSWIDGDRFVQLQADGLTGEQLVEIAESLVPMEG